MQVSKINVPANNAQQNNIGFKSGVAVFVKVGKTPQSALPAVGKDLNNTLMLKIVHMLKDSLKRGIDKERDMLGDALRKGFKSWVPDFYNKYVTAFTCMDGGVQKAAKKTEPDVFLPQFYLATGVEADSVDALRRRYKDVHIESNWNKTADVDAVNNEYYHRGKRLMRDAFCKYHPFGGKPHAMVVTFEPVEKKSGEIKDYKLMRVEFVPVNNPEKPTLELEKL